MRLYTFVQYVLSLLFLVYRLNLYLDNLLATMKH